ncbi:MAG: hypothetical protein ACKN9V_06455, partial [Pseudomonadota bacterium]
MTNPNACRANELQLKSLLGTEFLKKEQIQLLISGALAFKARQESGHSIPQTLARKTVFLLFFEAST